ncbi:hypothetical protein SAMN02927937_02248 [Paenimyroides aquimaris]|uniref:Uncharacterized protein n=1 Tax=Paenimyroides marinum TaxID=1159016 RepID=A0A1H6LY04_9FLAO|nr:hypothetical protein SAMN02927937_02248 [Paenimyroides aquimaris]
MKKLFTFIFLVFVLQSYECNSQKSETQSDDIEIYNGKYQLENEKLIRFSDKKQENCNYLYGQKGGIYRLQIWNF